MKKGIIFGIGIGILIFGVVLGISSGSTPTGIPGVGGLPNSDDNEMSMSDSVAVKVIRGESQPIEGSTHEKDNERKTIQVNLDDGIGSSDKN